MSDIRDPNTHTAARVDEGNRLQTFTISENVDDFAAKGGDSYNINTGLIAMTGTSSSAVFYLQNNETRDLVLTHLIFGVGILSATITDDTVFTLVRNPTGGDVKTDATAVSINANLNHGSSNSLSINVFKGKDGGTLTGGNDEGLFYVSSAERTPVGFLTIRIPTGQAIGCSVDLNTSGGGNVYFACTAHLHDSTQI